MDKLFYVFDLLQRCGFPQTRWHELGLRLGLYKNTLDAIKRDNDTTDDCLTECLSQWLSRADNVDSKGGATFDSLSDALKSMNENAAADKLDQEKKESIPPSVIERPPIASTDLSNMKLSELIEFVELLIKEQMEEFLSPLDADIRKINDHEEMSFRTFEEHPILTGKVKDSSPDAETFKTPSPAAPVPSQGGKHEPLSTAKVPAQCLPIASKPSQSQDSSSAPHDPTATVLQDKEEKKDPSSFKPMEGSMSPEYITMKEMLADLVDLLAGNAPVISQLNNRLFSSDVIPTAVHVTVESTAGLTPYDRANKIFSSVLATLESHSNPNSVFSSLIASLRKVGLNDMASKLIKKLRDKGGSIKVEQIEPPIAPKPHRPSLTNKPSLCEQYSDTKNDEHEYQIPHLQPWHVEPYYSGPAVIQLHSREEVAREIDSLHQEFTSLATKIRKCFNELVSSGKLEVNDVRYHAEEYLKQGLQLSDVSMDTIFIAISPHHHFFNFGLLKSLVHRFISLSDDVHAELIQYIKNVDEFSESSQLKHIRSTIKEKLSSLPAAASPTTSDQIKVVIKLHDRWEEMTLQNFKRVLKYYFGHKVTDISTIVEIDKGSVIITLLVPTSLSQSIIDTINNNKESMSRLGILEVAVEIPIRKKDDNNFSASLNESFKADDSFEVHMLLQLGADPKDEEEYVVITEQKLL